MCDAFSFPLKGVPKCCSIQNNIILLNITQYLLFQIHSRNPWFLPDYFEQFWNTTLFSTDVRGFIFAGATPVKLFRAVYLCI